MFYNARAAFTGGILLYTRAMSWSMRRRLIILASIAGVLALGLVAFYFLTIHTPPSCVDHKQNQDEEGVDCGGSSCTYLCTDRQAAPSVRFVRPISPSGSRTDVIAYIDNPNTTSAAKDLHFTVELYNANNIVLARKEGSVDLPPASTVPIFIPNFFSGTQEAVRAFITFDTPEHLWYRYQDTRVLPRVEDVKLTNDAMPRVTATAVNPGTNPYGSMLFVATIFDTEGNAIAASRTVAASLPALGRTPLVFTWPDQFKGTVSRVEVIPVVGLP
jgi:hypothetical protein